MIFDSQGRRKYSALATKVGSGEPPSHLIVADTLPVLAARVGIDPGGLERTVERFNEFARTGVDEDFHRGENLWDQLWGDPRQEPNRSLGTLEQAPFYAIETRPGALATKGGLRVNADGQVLSAARPFAPIPGLYAAGNCSSGGFAGSYPGAGCTIGAAMTFGYLAGLHVASGAPDSVPTAAARRPA
jgi:3-oxosteroid 1-dehydrogenase